MAVATIACGKTTEEPPSVTRAPAENVSGTERLWWTQTAADSQELSTFQYAAYVDGIRVELTDVSCQPSTATSLAFDCSAPLPAMAAGIHTLEVAAFVLDGKTVVEGPRSGPMKMNKATPAR